jgi:hypothetical protein
LPGLLQELCQLVLGHRAERRPEWLGCPLPPIG